MTDRVKATYLHKSVVELMKQEQNFHLIALIHTGILVHS